MHKYLRAIGFSDVSDRKKMQKIVTDIILNATTRAYTTNNENLITAEFCKDFAENMGIAVCGEFDEEDKFVYEYFYPYLRGTIISSQEDVSVERHAARESYAGICDETRIGVSLIFYLLNMIPYIKAQTFDKLPIRGTSLMLSGLSLQGTIMMPLVKDEMAIRNGKKASETRNSLIAAARQGDEDAIETLTLEDMDTYTNISKKILQEDVFSLVDTYFMPYGVECDQYSVLGEIEECRLVTNSLTGEQVYQMRLVCNELTFDICINIIDLLGEPKVGRRFKGTVWMQGTINFPENL